MTKCMNLLSSNAFSVVLAACAVAGIASVATPPHAAADPAGPDMKAAAVADQVLEAGGGAEALVQTKYIRFTFAVEKEGVVRISRTHYWDRVKDRHRLETIDKDGSSVVCLMHLPVKEGVCTVGDKALFDEDAKPWIERAYEAWTNDTYWLLMPYKMKDRGVHLKYDGEVKEGGMVYDKIALTFDDVGLTPNDRYWVYVDRKSHRVDRWAYVLQDEKGQPGAGEPSVWAWKGWSRFGKLMLSTEKVSADGKSRILFRDVAVFDALPDDVFWKTAKVDLAAPKP